MQNFWNSIKAFFANLGHTIMADIITALPEIQQAALAAFSALLQAAIAYVEAKYGTQNAALKAEAPLSAEAKLALDNQKHDDAFNYIKAEVAKNPSAYPEISDSLLHCGIELYVQKAQRDSEGNHGNFPGGNSNG